MAIFSFPKYLKGERKVEKNNFGIHLANLLNRMEKTDLVEETGGGGGQGTTPPHSPSTASNGPSKTSNDDEEPTTSLT